MTAKTNFKENQNKFEIPKVATLTVAIKKVYEKKITKQQINIKNEYKIYTNKICTKKSISTFVSMKVQCHL